MTAVRRSGWGVADHAISAASNFLLFTMVASHVSAADLGHFALLYGYYSVAVELTRAACGEPLLVRFPRTTAVRREIGAATGAAAWAGLAAGLVLAAVAVFAESYRAPLVLAVLLPGLLVQDTYRMAFLAAGRPRRAVAIDLVWAIVQCAGTLAVLRFTTDVTAVLWAWGVAGHAAAVLAVFWCRALPRPAALPSFVRRYGVLARPYLVEAGALAAAGYVVLVAVGGLAGPAAAGALRAAQTLYGPANVVLSAGRLLGIAELSRLAARAPERLPRGALVIGVALAGVGALAGAVALALPDRLGTRLLGESWPLVVPLLGALAVQRVAMGATTGPTCALRALEAVRALLALRLAAAAATVAGGVAGAAWAGAPGAAAGLAAGAVVVWPAALATLWRHRPRVPEVPDVPETALDQRVRAKELA